MNDMVLHIQAELRRHSFKKCCSEEDSAIPNDLTTEYIAFPALFKSLVNLLTSLAALTIG